MSPAGEVATILGALAGAALFVWRFVVGRVSFGDGLAQSRDERVKELERQLAERDGTIAGLQRALLEEKDKRFAIAEERIKDQARTAALYRADSAAVVEVVKSAKLTLDSFVGESE